MHSEEFDEEGLLKNMQLSELTLKISKLTFGWNYQSDPIKDANILLDMVRRISLDISEYEQRMSHNLSEYQRNKIYIAMEDLEKVIPYMKNKIQASEGFENILSTDNSN